MASLGFPQESDQNLLSLSVFFNSPSKSLSTGARATSQVSCYISPRFWDNLHNKKNPYYLSLFILPLVLSQIQQNRYICTLPVPVYNQSNFSFVAHFFPFFRTIVQNQSIYDLELQLCFKILLL